MFKASNLILIITALFACWSPSRLLAVEIYSFHINGLVHADGTGIYQQLLVALAAPDKLPYTLKVLPARRTFKVFYQEKQSCLLAGDTIIKDNPKYYIYSQPLGGFRLYLFNLPGQIPLSSYADLPGTAVVGGTFGHEPLYKKIIPTHLQLSLVGSDQQNLGMLEKGRVDAVLGFMPDFRVYQGRYQYDAKFILHQGYDRIICHNTLENQTFLGKFDLLLNQIKSGERYRQIMGKFYLDL